MKGTTTRTVTRSVDQVRAARMTPEQSARFAAIRDEDIDYSDIPDQGGKPFTRPGSILNFFNDAKKQPTAQANGAGKRKSHAH
jgi:hypothetical protein